MLIRYLITLLVMSIITLVVFLCDCATARNGKKKARRVRIPEYVLLVLTSLGGAVGAVIATLLTRHKTRKLSFKVVIYCALIIQVATAILLFI